MRDLDAAQKTIRSDPHNSFAYLRLGEIYLALGKVPEGARALRRAAQLAPHSQAPYADLARLYQQTGYLDYEIVSLRHLADLRSPDPLVYLRLAQIYIHLYWLAPAHPMLQQALKLAPNMAAAQLEMGHYLFMSGKTQQSINYLQAAHRSFPDDLDIAGLLAQYYNATNDYTHEEAVLRETLRAHPSDINLQVQLAYTLMEESRPETRSEAITLLQNAIRAGQRLPEAYSWLGRIYASQRRVDEAIAAYQKAVQIEPSFEDTALALGRLYLRQGKRQEGERYIRFYQTINRNSIAYSTARDILTHHLNDPNAHLDIGNWYMKLKQYPEAIVEFKQVLKLRPHDATARKQLDTAFLAMGRRTEAKALLAAPNSFDLLQ